MCAFIMNVCQSRQTDLRRAVYIAVERLNTVFENKGTTHYNDTLESFHVCCCAYHFFAFIHECVSVKTDRVKESSLHCWCLCVHIHAYVCIFVHVCMHAWSRLTDLRRAVYTAVE